MTKLVIIRIHGQAHLSPKSRDTLRLLRLDRKFACVIIEDSVSTRGMLQQAKDQVTWGELSAELAAKIGDKKLLHLQPPRGGFERKGTKKQFTSKGALGYRKEKINDLLKRMM
ncbi:MAG: uL30 family ribosomal protein [Nanoarchaeota archaeon]